MSLDEPIPQASDINNSRINNTNVISSNSTLDNRQSCVIVRIRGNDIYKHQSNINKANISSSPFSHSFDGKITSSCSGFIINLNNGIILTSSSIFLPFLIKSTPPSNNQNNNNDSIVEQPIYSLLEGTEIDIMCNNNKHLNQGDISLAASTTPVPTNSTQISSVKIITHGNNNNNGEERVYDPLVDWKTCQFMHFIEACESNIAIFQQLKSYFILNQSGFEKSLGLVVLRAIEPLTFDVMLQEVRLTNSLFMTIGSPVNVVASPFGFISPTIFLNSVSNGVICNCIQNKQYTQPSLYLTDARCLPGSEGGAVFNSNGHLIGIISSPIKSKDEKSPFNLSPFIPTHTFINQLLNLNLLPPSINNNSHLHHNHSITFSSTRLPPPIPPSLPQIVNEQQQQQKDQILFNDGNNNNSILNINNLVIEKLLNEKNKIVLVKFRDTWGSGVIISESGYVLTNAHLLTPTIQNNLKSNSISILNNTNSHTQNSSQNHEAKHYSNTLFSHYHVDLRVNFAAIKGKEMIDGHTWYGGSIEYISHTHLDIALLKIKKQSNEQFHHVKCDTLINPTHATQVAVLGFPLIPPSQDPFISITNGVISNIVYIDGCAVSYQTTAPVHSGNSGGGLFDFNGNFLGIVTCNAKQKNGSIITDLNFSIPVTSLSHFFTFANGEDSNGLEMMRKTVTNKFLKALWKLQITSSPYQQQQQQQQQQQPLPNNQNHEKYNINNRIMKISDHKSINNNNNNRPTTTSTQSLPPPPRVKTLVEEIKTDLSKFSDLEEQQQQQSQNRLVSKL